MPQSKLISRFLTEDGAQGSTHTILPADADPVTYSIIPTGSQVMEITRIIPFIRDGSQFSAETYGGIAALNPGITMSVMRTVDGVTATHYTLIEAAQPVTANADWAAYCHDLNIFEFGQGDEMLTARWTFAKSGKPIYLSAARQEWLEVTVAGTCTGLIDHHILAQGHYISQ